jgi:hypothetical protein
VSALRRLGPALSWTIAAAVAPLASADAQVAFERAGFRLTSIGERITVSGRVVDARRRPVANASIRWRVADPSIATVSPQGVVVSRKVGNTKLWAIAGDDSASALILVDQWAAKFDFLPSIVRLDAVGAKAPLRVVVRDAAGYPITSQNRRTANCRVVNDRVATMTPSGELTARTNGVTYVRCTDRGIADSVRVEVRQRPTRATIANKSDLGSGVLGQTFTIRLNATDVNGDPIQNVQATWASLNPTIASVDPLTGFTRLVGAGTARVVAQAGDVTDTLTIAVAPAQGLAVPANEEPGSEVLSATSTRMPTVKVDALYPFEGDTTTVRITARDASGVEIPNATVTLESSDTSIFVVLPRQRVLPKKAGVATLIAHFGAVTSEAQIGVRARGGLNATVTDVRAPEVFRRPTFNVDSIRRAADTARAMVTRQIFDSTRVIGLKAPSRLLSVALVAGPAAHSFSDTTGTEKRSGFLYGGVADIVPFSWVKLSGEFRTGSLTSSGTSGTELAITEAGGSLTIQPTEAFGVGGSYTRRSTREGPAGSFLALQQWSIPRAFAVVRLGFVGGAVRTIAGVNVLLPGATYTGYVDAAGNAVNPEPLSLGGEAGLEGRWGWFRGGLTYHVESFRFPTVGTNERRDQFSTVRLKLAWELSR